MQNLVLDKKGLLEILKRLLRTETDLNFLLNLSESELITLVTCIRDRFDQLGKQTH